MKKILLSLGLIAGSFIGAQEADSISMMPGYANKVYYNLEDGEVHSASNTDWHLAFSTATRGSSIRLNHAQGLNLYVFPHGDITDWEQVDTTGVDSWRKLYNSDTTWDVGAFNQYEYSDMDVGWGQYNLITHISEGDSVFVVDAGDTWKKFMVDRLANGVYHIKHADLDGSNEVTQEINKADFQGKAFAFYSLTEDSVMDKQPVIEEWDLVFTQYTSMVAPNYYMGVSGVLSNPNVEVTKVVGIDVADVTEADTAFSSRINAIGYDWKSLNYSTFQFEIEDSTSYLIKDQNDAIWKLVFTAFGGSSTGKAHFTKEKLVDAPVQADPTSVEGTVLKNLAVYPNPVQEGFTQLVFSSLESEELQVGLYDITGKAIRLYNIQAGVGLNQEIIDLNGVPSGTYFVNVNGQSFNKTQKLVIQ